MNKLLKSFLKIKYSKKIKNNLFWGINDNILKNTVKHYDFDEEYFINNSIEGYKLVYKSYIDNINFLDYQYTSPQLSIALNTLRNYEFNSLLIEDYIDDIDINNVKIINHWYDEGYVFQNKEIFPNNEYLENQFTAGFIGPEIKNLWDDIPIKENIRIKYTSNKYDDILIWERNTFNLNDKWIISNINDII